MAAYGRGIVITGTRGAGKTTLAGILANDPSVRWISSTTTRTPRADDPPGTYVYLTDCRFDAMLVAGELVLVGRYGGFRYGIVKEALVAVLRAGRRPLVTVSPEAWTRLAIEPLGVRWCGAFIDARDDILDGRLTAAGRPPNDWDRRRRAIDRACVARPLAMVDNSGAVAAAAAELRRIFGLVGEASEAPDPVA